MADTAPSPLIAGLLDPAAYPHPVGNITCIETHISWVLLTGTYAYKIKKPVALGFLDFSTLALRREACFEELRLNRRLAPQLYVDVVPISGPADGAVVLGPGEPIEYAVRMLEFPQADQLDRLLGAGRLDATDITRAAQRIARFHDEAPRVDTGSDFGSAHAIRHSVGETLRALIPLAADAAQREAVETLVAWTGERLDTLEPAFTARREHGCVRECHGDLHLGNLARIGDEVVPFDCIEFNAELRWIDVISDVAFLMMDLAYRDRARFAFRLINAYLEARGDYAGVAVLRFYLVYRALVRALVALLRRKQLPANTAAASAAAGDAAAHLQLAQKLASPPPPVLFLMHGLSGSGKTRVSDDLMERWPAIRVRSDVERKRLLGLAADQSTRSGIGAGAYSQDTNEATYRCLAEAAATGLSAGFSMIVDAASLQRRQRERFRALAAAQGVRFVIVSCAAPEAELRRRLRERTALGADASEADESVLDEQLTHAEPLDASELVGAAIVDTVSAGDADAIVARLSVACATTERG
ncbi:MAG TPA: AAA family ATPase [Rudaea sp.]|nr:AAA family ATPase [Rudaea sp.]